MDSRSGMEPSSESRSMQGLGPRQAHGAALGIYAPIKTGVPSSVTE